MLLYSLLIKFLVLLISAAERIQVEHFFQDSALSERPVVSDNNNNYKFLYSAIHNNRLNALYISALVIGPIASLLIFLRVYYLGNRSVLKAFSYTISTTI